MRLGERRKARKEERGQDDRKRRAIAQFASCQPSASDSSTELTSFHFFRALVPYLPLIYIEMEDL